VGQTYDELGGSHYYDLSGAIGNGVPKLNPGKSKLIFNALSKASSSGLVRAMHDCSDGGIGVACAEMAFAGGLGMELFLSEAPYKASGDKRDDFIFFSESNSRFIVEVPKGNQKKFEKIIKGLPFGLIGCVSPGKEFKVHSLNGRVCVKAGINTLKQAWQKPLSW